MQDFEKLGAFYLGKLYDLDAKRPRDEIVLYDAKDLTTHAVCVGMTGSGKTGLCLALLEEAAIDGIPAIAIDPKGDLSNLLLTFPDLKPADFQPWVDPAEATRKGLSVEQLAEKTADDWRKGLADWGQDPPRIERFKTSADVAVYTPGSSAGLPISLLRSFAPPSAEILQDSDALRERIAAAVSGLLALLGIDADPLRSREHILLSNIFEHAWRDGRELDLAALIHEIQSPPFEKIGVMDLESIFPAKDRYALSMSLNNLLASPGFAAWKEGDPLDIQRLLYTEQGKPRLAILSIAHLSDSERMFFVTTLLNEVISWMRRQPGTSSLRALLYMDEVFGYFPPSANPPAKTPMLTLLKQARAFGLGVVLATQNPVDLDYKGLSNAGTWFIGRLQTERDKARVLDGLEGASAAAGATFDRKQMDKIISGLGNRVFLMNNVHEDAPVVFQTRWALSYLRGPLTREQIQKLMAPRKSAQEGAAKRQAPGEPSSSGDSQKSAGALGKNTGPRPVLPPDIPEVFLPRRGAVPTGATLVYRPAVLGTARVHFAQASAGIDTWQELARLVAIEEQTALDGLWSNTGLEIDDAADVEKSPDKAVVGFAALPAELTRPKRFAGLADAFKDELYRTQTLKLWKCADLKEVSKSGESEGDFRARLSHAARERRDEQIGKLKAKYAPKLAALAERKQRAQQKVEREKAQAGQQKMQSFFSLGSTLLAALTGRKLLSASNINRAATAARTASRLGKESQDVAQAEDSLQSLADQEAELNERFTAEVKALEESSAADQLALEELVVKPKKTDLTITRVALLWTPWQISSEKTEPAF